ncbi:hypothetical protein C8A05DRAFT_18181 [Staphylotrichum tortipilum]|uniref:Peroxin 20 n=1 Tax=Staphylotrichum tortipilum TaxID=2831512 RepID=A0AAN6MEK2_9PEZI|nr:hypothetical protein C8A05DRAFT_18181 [Staphylotrichum longicolle]
MADSMCGPSNGAKNLLAHVDRDRAHHQDRLVNAPQASQANGFRSQNPFANNGAEMAFGGFQQAGMPMDAAFGPGLDMNAMGPVGPQGRAFAHPGPAGPAAMANIGPGVPAARLASPATGGTSHQDWVNQFSGMQLGPAAAGPAAAMPIQAHAAPMTAMAPALGLQQTQFGMPMYGAAGPGLFGFQNPAMNTMAQPQAALAQDNTAAIDVEAFNRAFDEYDDANFETELAGWSTESQQRLANTEFAEAQDKWMAEHGPSATATTTANPPTAAEMAVIDANLEELALEQDKRRSDEELARAAVDIVNSVAGNTSDKFKNSRFFELMRRIGNREVVVEGDSFVNAETGEAVVDHHRDNDDDDQSPANRDSDSGIGSETPVAGAAAGVTPPKVVDLTRGSLFV